MKALSFSISKRLKILNSIVFIISLLVALVGLYVIPSLPKEGIIAGMYISVKETYKFVLFGTMVNIMQLLACIGVARSYPKALYSAEVFCSIEILFLIYYLYYCYYHQLFSHFIWLSILAVYIFELIKCINTNQVKLK